MQINLTAIGNIADNAPKTFFRVECWRIGRRIADFTNQAEAQAFAIKHARDNGYRFDHKVATIRLAGH